MFFDDENMGAGSDAASTDETPVVPEGSEEHHENHDDAGTPAEGAGM